MVPRRTKRYTHCDTSETKRLKHSAEAAPANESVDASNTGPECNDNAY